jgi:hypothetical protein
VYNIATDISEKQNLSGSRKDLIAKAAAILKDQSLANETFPLEIPSAEE